MTERQNRNADVVVPRPDIVSATLAEREDYLEKKSEYDGSDSEAEADQD